MVNPKKTEEQAVNAIKFYFDAVDFVDTSKIAINDKEPGLDGVIDVYSVKDSEQFSKSNLKFSMPVQVKGTTKKITNNKHFVQVVDLSFYQKHSNGLVYFVVSTFNHERRILFRKLAPLDIKEILEKIQLGKETQKAKTLSFTMVPNDPKALINIFNDLHAQQERQSRNVLDLSEIECPTEEIVAKVTSRPKYLEDTISSGVYFYRKSLDSVTGKNILIPYSSGKVADIFELESGVISDRHGNSLTSKIYTSKKTGQKELLFGYKDSIKISWTPKQKSNVLLEKVQIHFTPRGDFSQRLADVNFLLEYLRTPTKPTSKEFEKWNSFIDALTQQEARLRAIIEDLKVLNIPISLNPDDLTNDEIKNLNNLQRVLHNELFVKPLDQHVNITLAGKKYDFFIHKNRIINYFTPEFSKHYIMQIDDEKGDPTIINPYISIYENLEQYPNFSIDLVIKGFEDTLYDNPEIANYYNQYVLTLLLDFDRSGEAKILFLADIILKKIENNLPKEIATINSAQIKKRLSGTLGLSALKSLIPLTDSKDQLIQFASFVLLEQKEEVLKKWHNLSPDQQTKMKEWPIFYLAAPMIS
ncbi:hypothetical protein AC564_2215c [Lacticaseibacillus paracasei]|nr:hypothetical protein AC564_2215c [Lacticaseibacillus paracasei]